MSTPQLLTICYVLVGLAATYNHGVAFSFLLGLVLVSVVRWRTMRPLEVGAIVATTFVIIFCLLPGMGPGVLEIFLLTLFTGLIWGNQDRTMKPWKHMASPSTEEVAKD